ncbi:MAG: HAMP domain-containing sensor histidine kinase [Lachnospiraceae bacterium]|nr:HAMP domain-containing sensor histidine kinase [Lachnospiraceae bacterium]
MKHGKHSVRVKMILLTWAAVFGTVALCLVLNEAFLVRYYEASKQKILGEVYAQIDRLVSAEGGVDFSKGQEASGEGDEVENADEASEEPEGISEELRLKLDILCSKSNITTVIIKDIISNTVRPQAIVSYFFGTGGKNNQDTVVIRDLIGDYFLPGYGAELKEKHLEAETENYSIFSLYDARMESKYIELVGYLDSGEIILMRSNVESMQESVKVANKFLLYAGLVSAIVISGIMYFVSRRFTRPILKLADISKKMSELNFDVKYESKSRDEIGELGTSINALSEKLEKTISELKSANNELQIDIERKTQADEVRKEFLSNVTHELKTPIALIQGYAEGLKDNISESAQDREFYCDVIIDEAAKMNTMVKKLLTLNHLEYGTTQVEFSRFELTAVIRAVLNSTEILAKQKDVTVRFEEREPVYVWADEYMVEEVLTNYISNAFHHVEGAKIIEIQVIRRGNLVRVAVFNTGAPIPEEELENIWVKFYKVDKARTREYGGSGIGLSIVKAIMEAHNREYGVKNHASGVEFWFELDCNVETQN